MIGYLLRRLAQAIVVLFVVTIIVFVLIHLLPGGAARATLGPRASPAQIANFNHMMGYDRSLPVQYGIWIGQLFHANLGFSYQLNQSVLSLVGDRLPKTIVLTAISTFIALVLAIPIGVYQAVRRNTVGDYTITGFAFIFYAMPTFWLGILLINWFAIRLHWVPAEAPQTSSLPQILSQPAALVLPVATLALVSIALFSRYMRSSVMDNLVQDYVRTARAKGASAPRVLYVHVLRNSLIPIATLLGLSLPGILAGALITETVFNYPGMGLLFFQEAEKSDYPVLLGITLIVGAATVLGNFLADIAYAVLDPRVRYA